MDPYGDQQAPVRGRPVRKLGAMAGLASLGPSSRVPDSVYDPASVEGPTYQRWLDLGVFRADPSSDKPTFTIVIPPPNVTGSLHLGHAFQHTLMDALTRRRRMQGYDALWLPGMDHAGIATQNVVERALAKEGQSRRDLGRDEFVARVWAWKEEYGGKIIGQMRRLCEGLDWSRERFTMDAGLSRAVRTIFKRLYDDQLIYRAERITNWCPRCLTALSDIEVEHRDTDGELVSISYGPLTGATPRAETMLGDTAVAVPPDDEPYTPLVGTMLTLPLTGRQIPVVADEHVDPSFGTGAVKVTPGHDPNDFEIGRRHGLASITMLDERGVITIPGPSWVSTASRPARRWLPPCAPKGSSSTRSVRTCTRSGTALAAAPSSSRACPCSGSSRSPRWPSAPATRCGPDGPASCPGRWPTAT